MVKGTSTEGEEDGIVERKEVEKNGIIDKGKFFCKREKGGNICGRRDSWLVGKKIKKGCGERESDERDGDGGKGKGKVWCWDWTAEVFGVINTVFGEGNGNGNGNGNGEFKFHLFGGKWEKWECVSMSRNMII